MTTPSANIIHTNAIRLDASTACQLKCPSCPTASGEVGRTLGAGFLSFADFKRLVDTNPWVSEIELSNWGEIFLNKDLVKILAYAWRKNVALYAANGANLNTVRDDILEAVVRYRLRAINCSIDGASQDTYAQYRVNGNFDTVIGNIRAINAWKKKYRSVYPHLQWQFIMFGHNEHEIEKARKMAADLNMTFYPKLSWGELYNLPDFSPVRNKDIPRKATPYGVASRTEYRELYGQSLESQVCCTGLWLHPQINRDGRVLGCPVNHWMDYGNAFAGPLKDILNSERIVYARDMLMGRRGPRADIPCTTCKVYAQMQRCGHWIKPEDVLPRHHPRRRIYIMFENKILGPEGSRKAGRLWAEIKGRVRLARQIVRGDDRRKKITMLFNRGLNTRDRLLASQVRPLSVPEKADLVNKWKPYPKIDGFTPGLDIFTCHSSTMVPGHIPHPPHQHKEEELLMLLHGEADLILPGVPGDHGDHLVRMRPGQFVFYPAGFLHTLQAVSDHPIHYLMFKWHTPFQDKPDMLPYGHYDARAHLNRKEEGQGFVPKPLFEGPTRCLRKLECHTSTLAPGSGYNVHVDPYDVAIVVLEGTVATLGQQIHPHGVIFYAAGEPHGMRNPGNVTAKYIVFEFHGNYKQ